ARRAKGRVLRAHPAIVARARALARRHGPARARAADPRAPTRARLDLLPVRARGAADPLSARRRVDPPRRLPSLGLDVQDAAPVAPFPIASPGVARPTPGGQPAIPGAPWAATPAAPPPAAHDLMTGTVVLPAPGELLERMQRAEAEASAEVAPAAPEPPPSVG